MHRTTARAALLAAFAPAAALLATPALASTVSLGSSGTLLVTTQFTGSTTTPNATVSDYLLNLASGTNTYSFSDSFVNQEPGGVLLNPVTGFSGQGQVGFVDAFKFAINPSASQGNVITVAFSSGSLFNTANLQLRLYEAASASDAATAGAISAGSTSIVGWTSSGSGTSITASFQNLSSGAYFLDIAGIANGQFGGGYGGTLTLINTPAPVPVPASGWLLVSALGSLAFVRRRR
jgi:hypothetical protein